MPLATADGSREHGQDPDPAIALVLSPPAPRISRMIPALKAACNPYHELPRQGRRDAEGDPLRGHPAYDVPQRALVACGRHMAFRAAGVADLDGQVRRCARRGGASLHPALGCAEHVRDRAEGQRVGARCRGEGAIAVDVDLDQRQARQGSYEQDGALGRNRELPLRRGEAVRRVAGQLPLERAVHERGACTRRPAQTPRQHEQRQRGDEQEGGTRRTDHGAVPEEPKDRTLAHRCAPLLGEHANRRTRR